MAPGLLLAGAKKVVPKTATDHFYLFHFFHIF